MHDEKARNLTRSIEVLPGRHMVADVRGTGAFTAVLLHGLPGDRRTWASAGDYLEADRRLVVPDLLGFGESAALASDEHAETEARAVFRFLDKLGVDRFDLVGHDFGGPTALWMWRLAPLRIRSLALLATNAFRDTPIPGFLKVAKVRGVGEIMFRVLFGSMGLNMMWLQATGDRDAYPLRSFRKILASQLGVRSTREVLLRSLRDLDRLYADVEAAVPTVTVPRLVVWGDRDPFFSLGVGQRLARELRAPFHALAGCGHFVPQERPREVADLLKALWRATSASP